MKQVAAKQVAVNAELHPAWVVRAAGNTVRLEHRSDGSSIKLRTRRAVVLARAIRRWTGKPADFGRVVNDLIAAGAMRAVHPTTTSPRVDGRSLAARALRDLLAKDGWHAPPIHVGAAKGSAAADDVVFVETAQSLGFVHGSSCSTCFEMRVAAGEAAGGRSTSRRRDAQWTRDARCALADLERAPLQAGEGLAVRNCELRRGYAAPHPDCPCGRAPVAPPGVAFDEIAATAGTPLALSKDGKRLLADVAFGPAQIERDDASPERFALREPFVWGSIRLVRSVRSETVDVSTYGGIFASTGDPEMTLTVARSEAVERLALRGARPHRWVSAARDPRAVPLRSLWSFATAADDKVARGFVDAVDLIRDRPASVPLEAVVVGLPRKLYPEAIYAEPFYSGGASHESLGRAVLHATIELCKRDVFMTSWYRGRVLCPLDWPRLTGKSSVLRDFLLSHGMELDLFDLTLDGPLAMVALRVRATRHRRAWPKDGVMWLPAGGFCAEEAVGHALALAAAQFTSIVLYASPEKDPRDPRAVKKFARTAAFWPLLTRYLIPAHARESEFLAGQGRRLPSELPSAANTDTATRLRMIRAWLRAAGREWLYVRLTDSIGFKTGFEVAKVILPDTLRIAPTRDDVDFGLPSFARACPGATSTTPNRLPHPLY